MRTLVVTEFMSLDGVVDSPGGEEGYAHSGWTFKDVRPEMAAYELKGREQEEAGALLVGRTSWEAFHEVWPTMAEFERYNEIPKYVVSSTLTEEQVAASPWKPTTLLRSTDDVAALKETDGGEIQVHGSARLAQSLAAAGLVDRYHLLVFPLVLGTGGKRLFADDGGKTKLQLVDQASYSNGVQKLCYDVVR
jgi:dihydrofolate reductase